MSEEASQEEIVSELGANHGLDTKSYAVALKIKRILTTHLIDPDTSIDSGMGENFADLFIKVDGREYLLTIQPSSDQTKKEAN